MKNTFKKLPLIAVIVMLIGCDNDELKTTDEQDNTNVLEQISIKEESNVLVEKGMLSFSTREDYDLTIDQLAQMGDENFEAWENAIGFTSMRSALTSTQREELGIFDDLLAVLISPDGKIEIADNVFELDAIQETVAVVPSSDYDKDGFSSKSVTLFSTDDNVLDILEGTDVHLDEAARRRYCSKRKLSWNYRYSNATNKIHAKVVYQKAGFLNSLQSIIEEETDLSGTPSSWNITLQTNGTNNFWTNKKHTNVKIPVKNPPIFNAARKNYRPYYSSRRLKKYRFSMHFKAQLKSGGNLLTKIITISC